MAQYFSQPEKMINEVAVRTGSSAPEPPKIKINSTHELESEMKIFLAALKGKETEENWESRELALQRLRGIIRGQSITIGGYNNAIRSSLEYVCKTVSEIITYLQLSSLRTTLVITACSALIDVAYFHQDHSESTTEQMIISLIKVCGSSKRILSSKAQNAIRIIIQFTPWNSHYPNIFYSFLADKNQVVRQASAECVKLIMEKTSESPVNQILQKSDALEILQKSIKKSLEDAYGTVRELGKDSFYYLQQNFPTHAARFL